MSTWRSLGRLSNLTRLLSASTPTWSTPAAVRTMSIQAPTFPKTPVPKDPLGPGKWTQTAACLIIGDEVLNGKTHDTNSNFMAKQLFDLGIDMRRVEVIPDEEEDIIEAARRMVDRYDLVVTSGGIGPTHDDITYQSLAKAFDPEGKLVYDEETMKRMTAHLDARKARGELKDEPTEDALTARKRMALFPEKGAEVLHVQEDLWVPVVRLQHKLLILPGVPRLFRSLLEGALASYVPLPPSSSKPFRLLMHTTMPESSIAPFLTSLAERTKSEGIRVGSYPKFQHGVDVSLIGSNETRLQELSEEVCKALNATPVELSQT